jgi:nitrate reductase NapE component
VLRTSAPLNGALERTDMQRASLLMWIKPRPVRIGVGVLVLLVVVLPFLVALAASFGPISWMHQISALLDQKYKLSVIAGVATASISENHPLRHAILAGSIGTLIITLLLGGVSHVSLRECDWGTFIQCVMEPALWCAIGGASVLVYKGTKGAL